LTAEKQLDTWLGTIKILFISKRKRNKIFAKSELRMVISCHGHRLFAMVKTSAKISFSEITLAANYVELAIYYRAQFIHFLHIECGKISRKYEKTKNVMFLNNFSCNCTNW